jgi:hypothetical protein
LKSVSEASSSPPSPSETTITMMRLAACMPTAFQMPRRKPWCRPLEMLENAPGPGETHRMIDAST